MRLDHIGEKENATLRKLTEKGEKKTFSSFNRKKMFSVSLQSSLPLSPLLIRQQGKETAGRKKSPSAR